jgi:hypothetical protein
MRPSLKKWNRCDNNLFGPIRRYSDPPVSGLILEQFSEIQTTRQINLREITLLKEQYFAKKTELSKEDQRAPEGHPEHRYQTPGKGYQRETHILT